MAATVRRSCNHIPSSPPPQGIVTILGADCDANAKPGSIRRTLSADMSSKKWLHQNGFLSPIKKIVSSHEIAAMADDQDQVWKSIQSQNQKHEPTGQTGVWGGLLLTQKSENSLLQTPYVHPMVKRSKSSLSDKSLEICTESLGSETGSDCFSSDDDDDRQATGTENHHKHQVKFDHNTLHVIKKNRKSQPRSFPPPLPSVAAGDLLMQSRRENGRLVLEAVSVQPRNFFNAQRQNGRLLLTLKRAPAASLEFAEEELQFDDVEEMVDRGGGGDAVVEEGKEEESLVEQNLSHLPTGMISVHKSVLMKKLMVVGNINPKWSDDVATRDGIAVPVPQSLPPRRPPVAPRTSSFNAYEYFWRKPGFVATNKNKNKMNQDLVMYMRGCKEARKSLFGSPYCIATS